MKVGYNEIMYAITKGLLKHREDEIIGEMLLKTEHTLKDLTEGKEAFDKIIHYLSPTSFNILSEIAELVGSDLEVIEDGKPVDFNAE